MLEDAFPTAALAGKARRHDDSPLHDEHLLGFLDANPTFDLAAPKLAERVAARPSPRAWTRAPSTTRLGDVQRLYKLEPRFSTIDTLMRDGITSASAIARMGKGTFVQSYEAKIGRARSAAVYETADHQSSLALAVYARYGASLNAVQPWAARTLPEAPEGVPNWETLFGSLDLCECEHCRSIFSPAAYMVDALAFLRRCSNPASGPRTALDALLERRPDIAHLKLSCENTNTPIPYLDLVNELLERAILEGSDPPRPTEPVTQTVGTEAELGAHPQRIEAEVYSNDLATAVHPWVLPFDLWAAEARAYLANMDIERHRIMESLVDDRSAALRDEAIAGETLGLSPVERRIVTGQPLTPARTPGEFWGFEASAAGWLGELAAVPTLLRRAGLTYVELLDLLELRFLNPDGAVTVRSPERQLRPRGDDPRRARRGIPRSAPSVPSPEPASRLEAQGPRSRHRRPRADRRRGRPGDNARLPRLSLQPRRASPTSFGSRPRPPPAGGPRGSTPTATTTIRPPTTASSSARPSRRTRRPRRSASPSPAATSSPIRPRPLRTSSRPSSARSGSTPRRST